MSWRQFDPDIFQAIWILVASIGVGVSALLTRIVLRNYWRERLEPHTLRARLARAHLRRALIRGGRLLLNLMAGIISAATPHPLLHQVTISIALVSVILVAQAVADTVDLILDYVIATTLFSPYSAVKFRFLGRTWQVFSLKWRLSRRMDDHEEPEG